MTYIVIILFIFNLAFLSYFVKKWIDSSPVPGDAPAKPRGGEKPINDFFSGGKKKAGSPDAEITEMAERLLDRIDRKIEILRELSREADTKIDMLTQAVHSAPPNLPRTQFDGVASVAEASRRNRGATAPAPEQPLPENDKRTAILLLHKRGLSSSQIAQEVRMGRGEVELILRIEGLR